MPLNATATKVPGFIRKIWPNRCPACEKFARIPPGQTLCAECLDHVALPPENMCRACCRPLDFEYEIETGESYRCGTCIENPPIYESLRFALMYKGPVRELIHSFKFKSHRRLSDPLANLGHDRLVPWLMEWPDAVVVPVPLAIGRLFKRGYNPSYLLAKKLCGHAGLSVAEGALRRIRQTKPQFGLNVKERLKNVKGAFAVHDVHAIRGKRVILFDDIHTTGATVTECCKVLKKAKPEAIRVATLCRAGES